jgi:hypothetical protein
MVGVEMSGNEDPYYYVMEDPNISDVLLVAADTDGSLPIPVVVPAGETVPECDIYGYDCECEPKTDQNLEHRKPDLSMVCPDESGLSTYNVGFGERDVEAFNAFKYDVAGYLDDAPADGSAMEGF